MSLQELELQRKIINEKIENLEKEKLNNFILENPKIYVVSCRSYIPKRKIYCSEWNNINYFLTENEAKKYIEYLKISGGEGYLDGDLITEEYIFKEIEITDVERNEIIELMQN